MLLLRGERIVIRTPRLEDAPHRLRWFSNPDVVRHLPSKTWTLEAIRATIERSISSDRPELGVAVDLKDGTTIGCGGFRGFDESQGTAEISVLIGERALWGLGYGGETMRLLLEHGFFSLGLRKIWLVTRKDNQRATKLFTGLGFRIDEEIEGTIAANGSRVIKLRMSLLKGEFK